MLEDGSPLTADVLRRLACDAARVAVLRGEDDQPLSAGRRTRTIPPAIRRALQIRDGGCRFPGCQCNRQDCVTLSASWGDDG